MGSTSQGKTGYPYLVPTLANMLKFLPEAQKMKSCTKSTDDKEPYGPGCRDYFWLLCRLVENVSPADAERGWADSADKDDSCSVDLNALLVDQLIPGIRARPFLEQRHSSEDDGLIGLLHLASAVLKHDPPAKSRTQGQEFLSEVNTVYLTLRGCVI